MKITLPIINPSSRMSVLLVSQIYERATIAIIATAMNSTILAFVLWDLISKKVLVPWYILTIFLAIVRFVQTKIYQRTSVHAKDIKYWAQLMFIGLGISGILWGSAAIFLFPVESTAHQAFVVIVLAGMVAGAVGVLSPIMSFFFAFSIPALTPIFIRFIAIGDELHMAMGFMTLIFAILTFTTAERLNRTIKELISLRLTFENQLQERTAELKEVNKQLQQEIEERKHAENAFRKSEEKYRRITENISDVVWITDLDLKTLYVSPSVERLFGEPVDVFINKPLKKRYPPDSLEKINSIFQEELEKEKDPRSDKKRTRIIELKHFCNDGSTIWVSMNVSILRDKNGNPVGIQGVTSDITERKKAEEALREKTQLLENIMDNMHDLVSLTDMYGYFKFVSSSHKILGYDPDFLIGKSVLEFIHPDDLSKVSSVFQQYLVKPEEEGKVEYRYRCADGTYLHFETVRKFIQDINRNPKEILFSTRDITKRKLVEQEHEKLRNQLLQSQKMESIGRLAGGVAHDFNNMLGVIIGYTEVAMEKAPLDNSLNDYLAEILKAARRSADITKQLLAFARKQTIAPIVCDLNEILETMLKMLRRLIGEDIDFAWFPESKLWSVKMDPSQIEQILANLCLNARDAISEIGKVTIKTQNITIDQHHCIGNAECKPGDYVAIAVSDNGCGMDKDTIAKIFEPFFTTKDVGKGTGLGLPTVYGIVKQNMGFINVYSEVAKGTTIEIFLPRYFGESKKIKKEVFGQISSCHNEIILLVEDEVSFMRITKMMLETFGYRLIVANTPSEAISLAKGHPEKVHLLITDVVMPEMNGRELANKLYTFCPDIKVLFMSGYPANVIAKHGVLGEGMHFIQKPFTMNELAIAIRKIMDQT
ncbi:MAG: PAS domain S-box protein [Desulfobacterales bacterium]